MDRIKQLTIFTLVSILKLSLCQDADTTTTYDTTFIPSLSSTGDRIPLYIGGYFPLGGGWDGSGNIVAAEMALDHINNNPNILEDYELLMVWNDTQVS